MTNQRRYILIGLVAIGVIVVLVTGWVMNVVKLANCDFQAPYKCEVIHGAGLFPPAGAVTGWLDVGK